MAVPTLPPELLYIVFDELVIPDTSHEPLDSFYYDRSYHDEEREAKEWLSSCASVCRLWREVARPYQFSMLAFFLCPSILSFSTRTLPRTLAWLKEAKHIVGHVRKLRLVVDDIPAPNSQINEEYGCDWGLYHRCRASEVYEVLHSFPNLRVVEMVDVIIDFSTMDGGAWAPKQLYPPLRLDSLHYTLHACSRERLSTNDMVQLLGWIDEVKELKIGVFVRFDRRPHFLLAVEQPMDLPTTRIEMFDMTSGPPEIDWFLPLIIHISPLLRGVTTSLSSISPDVPRQLYATLAPYLLHLRFNFRELSDFSFSEVTRIVKADKFPVLTTATFDFSRTQDFLAQGKGYGLLSVIALFLAPFLHINDGRKCAPLETIRVILAIGDEQSILDPSRKQIFGVIDGLALRIKTLKEFKFEFISQDSRDTVVVDNAHEQQRLLGERLPTLASRGILSFESQGRFVRIQ